jgi:hypothetical protein
MASPSLSDIWNNAQSRVATSINDALRVDPNKAKIDALRSEANLQALQNQVNALREQAKSESVPFDERLNRHEQLEKLQSRLDLARQSGVTDLALGARGTIKEQDRVTEAAQSGLRKGERDAYVENLQSLQAPQRDHELAVMAGIRQGTNDLMDRIGTQTAAEREFYREMSKPDYVSTLMQSLLQAGQMLAASKLIG